MGGDVENAKDLMTSDLSAFDQVKAAVLARKLYDLLGVSPVLQQKAVTDATMTITEHYAGKFSESVVVVEHASTLIMELSTIQYKQNFLVHLSKSVLSSAAISTGQPIAVEN